jgi:hypothetical protein
VGLRKEKKMLGGEPRVLGKDEISCGRIENGKKYFPTLSLSRHITGKMSEETVSELVRLVVQ